MAKKDVYVEKPVFRLADPNNPQTIRLRSVPMPEPTPEPQIVDEDEERKRRLIEMIIRSGGHAEQDLPKK
jgi:hypothetical protein